MITNAQGVSKPAAQWLAPSGRARMLENATVTADECAVPAADTYSKRMTESWRGLGALRRGQIPQGSLDGPRYPAKFEPDGQTNPGDVCEGSGHRITRARS